jgi:DNA-binding response OmpR family regulator
MGARIVRVLLIEDPRQGLPFLDDALEVDDTIVTRGTEVELPSLVPHGVDLFVVARREWTDNDTELCRRVHTAHATIPLLAVSGPCDTPCKTAALRAGADEFLSIPFELDELAARTFTLVRRAASGSRQRRAGAFTVDFARRQVLVAGRALTLTLREFDLLALLIERYGEVVTRRELAGSPSPNEDPESNVVDVHMSRIREKLGKLGAQIETVRGAGYRLRG